ncbi:MAG TPA: hypothetical protein VMT00_08530 [Thermoanaerobaculia bacterium]|nr:hypothetical protein [Thermoanaerobaculia bacterium]
MRTINTAVEEDLERTGRRGVGLDRLAAHSEEIDGVWKSALQWGDRVVIVTLNSVYTLHVVDDDRFIVSGGWFDRREASPAMVKVTGCNWGGTAINRRLVAAAGLYLEFANGVVTTQIQRVVHFRCDSSAAN